MTGLAGSAILDITVHFYAYPAAIRAPWPVLPTTALLLGLATAGGHLGGKLVYQLGVGTAASARSAATMASRAP